MALSFKLLQNSTIVRLSAALLIFLPVCPLTFYLHVCFASSYPP
jgi:hypothetical protein